MITVRVIKTWMRHECDACGMEIPRGAMVFALYRWRKKMKTLDASYFHYNPEVNPKEIPKMSGIEIRQRCCAYNIQTTP